MVEVLGEKKICKKCGKCCRLIASVKSYDELSEDAKNGDTVAVNFLKLFLPYESLEDALKIDAGAVQRIIDFNKKVYGKEVQTYFYYCRYVREDNLCAVYEMRPKLCRNYPKNEFVVLPADCSYEGYSFAMREKVKAKVRKAKEELLDIKIMRQTAVDKGVIEKLNKLEKKLNQLIEDYKAFGSYDW